MNGCERMLNVMTAMSEAAAANPLPRLRVTLWEQAETTDPKDGAQS